MHFMTVTNDSGGNSYADYSGDNEDSSDSGDGSLNAT